MKGKWAKEKSHSHTFLSLSSSSSSTFYVEKFSQVEITGAQRGGSWARAQDSSLCIRYVLLLLLYTPLLLSPPPSNSSNCFLFSFHSVLRCNHFLLLRSCIACWRVTEYRSRACTRRSGHTPYNRVKVREREGKVNEDVVWRRLVAGYRWGGEKLNNTEDYGSTIIETCQLPLQSISSPEKKTKGKVFLSLELKSKRALSWRNNVSTDFRIEFDALPADNLVSVSYLKKKGRKTILLLTYFSSLHKL